MKSVKFKVDGMNCHKCVSKILATMNSIDAVEEVDVCLENKIASIKYNSNKINEQKLKNIIESIDGKDFKAEIL